MRRIIAWGFALLVVGATLFFSIWSHQGFGAVDLSTVEYEKRSRNIDKAFHSVEITELADDVHIEPSPDGTCRVEYTDSSQSYHKISVESGCLTISRETKDRGKWYENIGIHTDMEEHLLVLYLPEAEYSELSVNTASADVYAGADFGFETVEIHSVSGDIDLGPAVTKRLTVDTASGDVRVGGLDIERIELSSASGSITFGKSIVSNRLYVATASGDIELGDISCRELEVGTASGQIELRNVIASGEMDIESVSGDIRLDDCDAASLELESTSGYISGRLLSGKSFDADTTSGDIRLPYGSTGGRCSIETTSGDIDFEIK